MVKSVNLGIQTFVRPTGVYFCERTQHPFHGVGREIFIGIGFVKLTVHPHSTILRDSRATTRFPKVSASFSA